MRWYHWKSNTWKGAKIFPENMSFSEITQLTVEILLSVFAFQKLKNFPWNNPREAVSRYKFLQLLV